MDCNGRIEYNSDKPENRISDKNIEVKSGIQGSKAMNARSSVRIEQRISNPQVTATLPIDNKQVTDSPKTTPCLISDKLNNDGTGSDAEILQLAEKLGKMNEADRQRLAALLDNM